MKNKLLYILFLLGASNVNAFSQTKIDTILNNHSSQIEALNKKSEAILLDVNTNKASLNTIKTSLDTIRDNALKFRSKDLYNGYHLSFIQWLLVFSPILLFTISLFIIKKKLIGFDLRDALTDSELPKETIPNPQYTATNILALSANSATSAILSNLLPPTIEVTANITKPKSSSRYIAFITSALTWIIILCLSCFFMYVYLSTGNAPDLSGLSSVMIALGIGVVPYAFNKVAAAIK